MIRSVNDASAGRTGPFPAVGGVLAGWKNTMTFRKITDTVVDGINVKTPADYPFEGVFQPMPPREIYFKSEGQRSWKWWQLWTTTDYDINIGDDIEDFNGVIYRVVKSSGWGQAGYNQFDLVEDYQVTT